MKHKLTLILALLFGLSISWIAQAADFAAGDGTKENPFQISTAAELAALNEYLGSGYGSTYFKLVKDIDLTEWLSETGPGYNAGAGWKPIGNWTDGTTSFFGNVDGDGYTVKGLWINRGGEDVENNVGLFGDMRGGSLSNLTVEIADDGVKGNNNVGGLIGSSLTPLTHCHVRGDGTVSASDSNAGGLAGRSDRDVSYCSSTVKVTSTADRVGGLIGYQSGNTILQSYATGEVEGEGVIGGLVGLLGRGDIQQCYATGDVKGDYNIGGLTGSIAENSSFTKCYATGALDGINKGGLIGSIYNGKVLTLESCFYLGEAAIGWNSEAATGTSFPVSADDLKKAETFTDKDWPNFSTTWYFPSDDSYPTLLTHLVGEGTGTEPDPYRIATPLQLANLNHCLGSGYEHTYFKIIRDIDLTGWLDETGQGYNAGKGWKPIGNWTDGTTSFYGHVDGGGYTVKGLWINRGGEDGEDQVGLFGDMRSGSLSNLTVEIADEGVKGKGAVGGLVGNSSATLTHCHVRGEGIVSASGYNVGGLAGWSGEVVSYCSSTVKVTSEANRVGGLIGTQTYNTILQSYATGEVIGVNEIGGLVGLLDGLLDGGTIQQCYATGDVEGFTIGGLTGYISGNSTFIECYATGALTGEDKGGLSGFVDINASLTLENCFYRDEMGEEVFAGKGEGATINGSSFPVSAEDLLKASTFTAQGWEFLRKGVIPAAVGDNGWKINYDESMPWLWWEYREESEDPIDPVSLYHTQTLIVAPGIELYGITAGEHTVADGEHLHLQFRTEDPSLTAADLLFLIDGVETPFRDFGSGNYFSYILNPITAEHTILIAQREYTVTLPQVEGLILTPGAGSHPVAYGEPFSFTIALNDLNLLNPLKVLVNGILLAPDNVETLHATSLQYTIDSVTGPVRITIEGLETTGNGDIAAGNIQLRITNYELQMDNTTGKAVDVAVYTLRGEAVATRRVTTTEMIRLATGVYLVRAGNETWKVVIP